MRLITKAKICVELRYKYRESQRLIILQKEILLSQQDCKDDPL